MKNNQAFSVAVYGIIYCYYHDKPFIQKGNKKLWETKNTVKKAISIVRTPLQTGCFMAIFIVIEHVKNDNKV